MVTGSLTAANGDPLVDPSFTSSGFSCCETNVSRSNELRVSGDSPSPEPAPLALVGGGFGLIALFGRRDG